MRAVIRIIPVIAIVLLAVVALDPWAGASTPGQVAHATVTNASTAILSANQNRKFLLLQNQGAVDIFCEFAVAAVASQGIDIPAGQTFIMDGLISGATAQFQNTSVNTVPGGAVACITASGSAVTIGMDF